MWTSFFRPWGQAILSTCNLNHNNDFTLAPLFRPVFSNPKSIQASVTLLEKLAIILDKSTEEDMRNLVLPLIFNSLESKMSQIQVNHFLIPRMISVLFKFVATKEVGRYVGYHSSKVCPIKIGTSQHRLKIVSGILTSIYHQLRKALIKLSWALF